MANLIAEYEQHLRDLRRADATITLYIDTLSRMDRDIPHGLTQAHADEIKDWILAGHRSDATVALYRTVVAGFFRWATDPNRPRLDFNPAVLLPRVRVPDTVNHPMRDDQLTDLLRRGGEPFRTWFLIAAYAGLRCVELAGLDRAHVTAEHLWVVGKGGRERLVPTHPEIWAVVRGMPDGPVARSEIGGRTNRRAVSLRGNRRIHQLGHDGWTMHDLRRWFGTSVFEAAGNNLRVAQQLLGHASIATTQRYLLTADPARAAAVNRLRLVA